MSEHHHIWPIVVLTAVLTAVCWLVGTYVGVCAVCRQVDL